MTIIDFEKKNEAQEATGKQVVIPGTADRYFRGRVCVLKVLGQAPTELGSGQVLFPSPARLGAVGENQTPLLLATRIRQFGESGQQKYI